MTIHKIKRRYIQDAAHGWLKVPYNDLVALGLTDKISSYSYLYQGVAFLEEDCDMSIYLTECKKRNWDIELLEEHPEDYSKIRNFPSYPAN